MTMSEYEERFRPPAPSLHQTFTEVRGPDRGGRRGRRLWISAALVGVMTITSKAALHHFSDANGSQVSKPGIQACDFIHRYPALTISEHNRSPTGSTSSSLHRRVRCEPDSLGRAQCKAVNVAHREKCGGRRRAGRCRAVPLAEHHRRVASVTPDGVGDEVCHLQRRFSRALRHEVPVDGNLLVVCGDPEVSEVALH